VYDPRRSQPIAASSTGFPTLSYPRVQPSPSHYHFCSSVFRGSCAPPPTRLRPTPRLKAIEQILWDELQKQHFSLAHWTGTHQPLRNKRTPSPIPASQTLCLCQPAYHSKSRFILLLLATSGTLIRLLIPLFPNVLLLLAISLVGSLLAHILPGSWSLQAPRDRSSSDGLFLSSRPCT
jgi:hypothetical protein